MGARRPASRRARKPGPKRRPSGSGPSSRRPRGASGGLAGLEAPPAVPAREAAVPPALTSDDIGAPLGDRATLLQFSSAFCAPCRATRRVLTEVADIVPGVTHVEVDAESHLALVRQVGVQRTPTTLVLGADGSELSRAAGALRKPQVLHALAEAVGS